MLFCSVLLRAKAPFTFDAMMQLARIDDAQLSRDGKLVAFSVRGRHNGRALAPALGISRLSVGKPGNVSEVVSQFIHQEFRNTHSGHSRRDRFPRPARTESTVVYCITGSAHPFEADPVSGGGTLDYEAAGQPLLVFSRAGLVEPLHGTVRPEAALPPRVRIRKHFAGAVGSA